MNGSRPSVPPWALRLAAPVLLVAALPLAILVFAALLAAAGARAAASRLAEAWARRPTDRDAGPPIIEAQYVIIGERRLRPSACE